MAELETRKAISTTIISVKYANCTSKSDVSYDY